MSNGRRLDGEGHYRHPVDWEAGFEPLSVPDMLARGAQMAGDRDVADFLGKTLTYREREILKLRYGIGDGYTYTLEEVGRIFKVTRERVRQVESKAIRKLQHPVRRQRLSSFVGGAED